MFKNCIYYNNEGGGLIRSVIYLIFILFLLFYVCLGDRQRKMGKGILWSVFETKPLKYSLLSPYGHIPFGVRPEKKTLTPCYSLFLVTAMIIIVLIPNKQLLIKQSEINIIFIG